MELPTEPIVLPARDDAAEYDDSGDTHNFHDDANVVVWRKGNKAAVKFRIVPDRGMKPGDRSIFRFVHLTFFITKFFVSPEMFF